MKRIHIASGFGTRFLCDEFMFRDGGPDDQPRLCAENGCERGNLPSLSGEAQAGEGDEVSEVYVGWIYTVSGLGKVRVTNEFVHFVRPDQSRDYMTREDFEARIVGEPEPPVQSVVVTARKRATR